MLRLSPLSATCVSDTQHCGNKQRQRQRQSSSGWFPSVNTGVSPPCDAACATIRTTQAFNIEYFIFIRIVYLEVHIDKKKNEHEYSVSGGGNSGGFHSLTKGMSPSCDAARAATRQQNQDFNIFVSSFVSAFVLPKSRHRHNKHDYEYHILTTTQMVLQPFGRLITTYQVTTTMVL